MNNILKVVVVRTGQRPKVEFIEDDISVLRHIVGGTISTVPLMYNVLIILNDEGKINGKCRPNRHIFDHSGKRIDTVWGDFFIVQICPFDDEFHSLTDEQVNKCISMFEDVSTYADVRTQGEEPRSATTTSAEAGGALRAQFQWESYDILVVDTQLGTFYVQIEPSDDFSHVDVYLCSNRWDATPFDRDDEVMNAVRDRVEEQVIAEGGQLRVLPVMKQTDITDYC